MALPMVTAHTGNDRTPPNSLDSIRKALSLRPDAIEMDVRVDGNGCFVLSHNLGSPREYACCPRLEEALDLIRPYPEIRINLDLKDPDLTLGILDFCRERNIPPQQLILSGDVPVKLLRERPDINRMASVLLNAECIVHDIYRKPVDWNECLLDSFSRIFAQCGVTGLNLNHNTLSDETVELFHSRGVPLSVWTVDDEAQLDRFFRLGVLNITTRSATAAMQQKNDLLSHRRDACI